MMTAGDVMMAAIEKVAAARERLMPLLRRRLTGFGVLFIMGKKSIKLLQMRDTSENSQIVIE